MAYSVEGASSRFVATPLNERQPALALLPWGNVLEDFLDPLGVSLEEFCTDFRGSWLFGYVDALRSVGVRTILICGSKRVAAASRSTHRPTGATIWVLPAPRTYRAIDRRMTYPYGQSVREAFGELSGRRRMLLPLYAVARQFALYLATPHRALARVVQREGCTAILCQEYEYPRFDTSVVLGRLLGVPVFGCFQGGNYHHNDLERFIRPLTIRRCAGLIIGPEREAERVVGSYRVSRNKLAQIFNPIDVDLWKPVDGTAARNELRIPHDARVVAWHGRIAIDKKGLDILLDTWERLSAGTNGDLRLVLVGTGDDAEEFRRLLTTKHLPGILWSDEFIHDAAVLRRYLCAADVYVFASRYEGFPVAPLEAMACGLPIVATDVEGIPEILADGQASGGLVVPRNDPEALAAALGRLLDDPSWSRELGRLARRRVETAFSLTATGERLRAFLGLAS
jgi:glycosyltransferase involved in cell wall biosynthesis